MKSGKRHMTDGMELLNHDKIRRLGEEETYKYLGILEANTTKQVEMKDKTRKKYLRRTDKTLLQKPHQKNKYLRCAPLLYSGPFLKWARDELKQTDKITRKLIIFTNPSARARYDTRSMILSGVLQVLIRSFPSPRLVA